MPGSEDVGHDRDRFLRAAAHALDRAEKDRVGIPPLSQRVAGLTMAEAWGIAAARDMLRMERGESLTG